MTVNPSVTLMTPDPSPQLPALEIQPSAVLSAQGVQKGALVLSPRMAPIPSSVSMNGDVTFPVAEDSSSVTPGLQAVSGSYRLHFENPQDPATPAATLPHVVSTGSVGSQPLSWPLIPFSVPQPKDITDT